jgi:hypothetical protein
MAFTGNQMAQGVSVETGLLHRSDRPVHELWPGSAVSLHCRGPHADAGGPPQWRCRTGFYKFYYQVLHHWILDNNEYTVFCDLKQNRDRSRLTTLKRVLNTANRTSVIS